jgi:hypothetical protein
MYYNIDFDRRTIVFVYTVRVPKFALPAAAINSLAMANAPFDVVKSRIESTTRPAVGDVRTPWVWVGLFEMYHE